MQNILNIKEKLEMQAKNEFATANMELLEELAQKGKIDGVEVGHHSADADYRKDLVSIAEKYDLIQTGGSDFHGLYNAVPTHLGSETTTKENLDRIIKLASKM